MPRVRVTQSTSEILKDIDAGVRDLGEKLDTLIELQEARTPKSARGSSATRREFPLDVDTLLSLPDHLRKTAMVIARLREGTATDIAKETGRTRAAESDYLNQLVAMGYISKRRAIRRIVFYIGS